MLSRTWRVFGQVVRIRAEDPALFALVEGHLPACLPLPDEGPAHLSYRLLPAETETLTLVRGRRTVAAAVDRDGAARLLVHDLQSTLARTAAGFTFIHAGVVVIDGVALLLPAPSGGGKSTLVAALVRGGADYASDEFAVLDAGGIVYPYARPLALRTPGGATVRVRPEDIGGRVTAAGVRAAAIVFTWFEPGQTIDLRSISPGRTALGLLRHCLGARGRVGETMRVLQAVALGSVGFEGPRGEADLAARWLVGRVRAILAGDGR